jgi:hypothetical protein
MYIYDISLSPLRIRNVSDKSFREKTRISRSVTFSESLAVYEIMWKDVVEPDRAQIAI